MSWKSKKQIKYRPKKSKAQMEASCDQHKEIPGVEYTDLSAGVKVELQKILKKRGSK